MSKSAVAAAGRSRRSPRPWVVPPGLLVLDEPFEGYQVLEELRTEVGVLLWQCLRDVDLWAYAAPGERAGLFQPGALHHRMGRIEAEVDPAVPARPLLERFCHLLATPGDVRAMELSELCESTSRWASEQGLPQTALAFAQRSAMAAPDQPRPAYIVGLVARRAADYRRAETWFRRALALSRRSRDWRHYGLAHMGLANLSLQRGDAPSARARLLKALRAARRYGLWSIKPLVLHDLFCIEATGDDPDRAEGFALSAFRSYGRRHPRLPVLAHDIARFWTMQGQYHRAMATFRAVLPYIVRPPERMLAIANMGHAAGGAGDRELFDASWKEVWRIIDERDDRERAAEALINLALGAQALGETVRQEMAASYAFTIARRRSEGRERVKAEELVEDARRAGSRRRAASERPAPFQGRCSEVLAEELVEALTDSVDR